MIEFIICAAVIFACAAAVLAYRGRTRKTMETLEKMIDAAAEGRFTEEHFDESMLSAVETKMAHYLSASEVSAKNLSREKDKIKELVADISHQTKTPIANLLLYSELLDRQDLPEGLRGCTEPIKAQAEKLSFLIASLVKTSRLETGIIKLSPEKASVDELVIEAYGQIKPSADGKSIEVTVQKSGATAVFDLKWTAEALYNLLDNAVKYTPHGGKITISIQSYEMFCGVTVTDTGIGIEERELEKIFARFYRSPSVSGEKGVGIGLYLARQIAQSEGGYIKVKSTVGEGSSFSLFLPSGK